MKLHGKSQDETGDKDYLRLQKLQLFASPPSPSCQATFTGVATTGTKQWSGGKGGILGPPILTHCKEANLFLMLGYAHGNRLMAKTTPS